MKKANQNKNSDSDHIIGSKRPQMAYWETQAHVVY